VWGDALGEVPSGFCPVFSDCASAYDSALLCHRAVGGASNPNRSGRGRYRTHSSPGKDGVAPKMAIQITQVTLYGCERPQSRWPPAQGQKRMAKVPPSSNRPKWAKATHASGVHKAKAHASGVHKKVGSGAGKEVEVVLGDIRKKAGLLSAGADRLLRRA
jgi:hypothetical protein